MRGYLISMVCLLGAHLEGLSQWGSRSCTPVGRIRTSLLAADPIWQWRPAGPGQLALFRDGRQIGNYQIDEGCYHPYDGRTWGAPVDPPVAPPESVRKQVKPAPPAPGPGKGDIKADFPTGVEWDRVEDDREYYTLNGDPVSRSLAFNSLLESSSGLPDWSKRNHLTVIGSDEKRREVVKWLKEFPWHNQVHIQDYPPGHWALAPGFVQEGLQVYLQRPNGEVIVRLRNEGVTLAALRKLDPAYDPSKDPDPTKPPTPVPGPSPIPGSGLWSLIQQQPLVYGMLGGLLAIAAFFGLRGSSHAA